MSYETRKPWEPVDFCLQQNTVWSFPNRGEWATHKGDYRGNWSPYIPRNLILRYTNEGDMVLDPFVGSGTTLIESKLLHRNAIGVDINRQALIISKSRTNFIHGENDGKVYLRQGDARHLDFIPDSSIDLACVHPPYADIIKYSVNLEGDLSLLEPEEFINEMKSVAQEMYRVLRKGKKCALLIADIRKRGNIVPISFQCMEVFLEEGFLLKETVIKEQHNCKMTDVWMEESRKHNFLLIAHEYLFIFEK